MELPNGLKPDTVSVNTDFVCGQVINLPLTVPWRLQPQTGSVFADFGL